MDFQNHADVAVQTFNVPEYSVMAVTIKGESCWFGLCEKKPQLPTGFVFIERPGEWLLVESPEGQQYFIQFDSAWVTLIPRKIATVFDWIRTFGRLKIGTVFADDRSKIGFMA